MFALAPVVLWLTVFLLTLFGIEYGVLRPLDRFVRAAGTDVERRRRDVQHRNGIG